MRACTLCGCTDPHVSQTHLAQGLVLSHCARVHAYARRHVPIHARARAHSRTPQADPVRLAMPSVAPRAGPVRNAGSRASPCVSFTDASQLASRAREMQAGPAPPQ
eukprot:1581937-Alexandrium_andersonii.AAC.1